jgi:hypothetical protein
MNRFYIKTDQFGTDAAAVLPSANKVIQLFIGNDGSRTIQSHPHNHGQALAEVGLSNYQESTSQQFLELLTNEHRELLVVFLSAAFGFPREAVEQMVKDAGNAVAVKFSKPND